MEMEHLYELLFQAVREGTIDAVRKASSEIFKAPVFITDTSFRVLSADPDPGSKDDMLEKHGSLLYVSSSLLQEFHEHHLLDEFVSKAHEVILVSWGWFREHPHITTGIFYHKRIIGVITVLVQSEEISDDMKNALLQCADACAIVLHQNEEGRKHLQTRDHFASQLFRGYASADAITQAFHHGYLQKSSHYVITASELPPDLSWEMILQNQCGCLLYNEGGITYILTPSSSDISPFTDWVISRGYRIGISFPFSDLTKCQIIAEQAKLSVSYGRTADNDKKISFPIESLHILMRQENNGSFIHPVVHEIRTYDQENHTEYIATLTSWLESAMNDSLTAEKMHIHRNTLYYRLHRISELFHIDLHDMKTCVQLYLSLQ